MSAKRSQNLGEPSLFAQPFAANIFAAKTRSQHLLERDKPLYRQIQAGDRGTMEATVLFSL